MKCQSPCNIGRVNYLDFADRGISTIVLLLSVQMAQ